MKNHIQPQYICIWFLPNRTDSVVEYRKQNRRKHHDEKIVGTAVINKVQVKEYYDGNWEFPADDSEVMVLHALVISPDEAGRGLGKAFVAFYEEYALLHGCHYLRMDTNEKNVRARALYKKLGFSERGNIPCTFNGIHGVQLILLEKKI